MSNEKQVIHIEQTPLAPVAESTTMMSLISRAAADPNADIDKMERLMAMHERMLKRDAEMAFNEALSDVQSQMGRISGDKSNAQTKSMYATYAKLDAKLRPLYTAAGFALSFGTEKGDPGEVAVVCTLSHKGGHTREYRASVPSDGKGIQGNNMMTRTHAFGSGATYGMRYLLKMIFNVAIGEHDDDGNAATPQSDTAVTKANDWIKTAADIQEPADYNAQRAKMMTDYGGKVNAIPAPVKMAFNEAKARVMPKDEE